MMILDYGLFKKKKPRETKCLEIVVRWLIKMTRFWGFFLNMD